MKFYTLLNNRGFIQSYKFQLNNLKNTNILSDIEYNKAIKDLSLINKSLGHNLILFNHESNPNIYYLMTKVTKPNGFDSPRNGFESGESRKWIEINQVKDDLGYAKCLFQLELQNSNEINEFLIPLNEDNIKISFGSLENAEHLYKSAQEFYALNKNNPNNWVDVTRYFFERDEIYKQYSYINFMKNPYYPFKLNDNLYEYDETNVVDLKAQELLNLSLKKSSEDF